MKLQTRQKPHIHFRTLEDRTKGFRTNKDTYYIFGKDNKMYKFAGYDNEVYILNSIKDDYRNNTNTCLTTDDVSTLSDDFLYMLSDEANESKEAQEEAVNNFYTHLYRLILTNKI